LKTHGFLAYSPARVGPQTGGLPIPSPLIFSVPSASLRLIDEISGLEKRGNKSMHSGTLYIVSAPSGAGKTSLVRALLDSIGDIQLSVSHTTRARRLGEVDGEHYHFVDLNTFESMIAEGAFLEYARVFSNYYGTSRHAVVMPLKEGYDVMLEIDWQGARQVRENLPNPVSIFILPPSRHTLEERLLGRRQDSLGVIAQRMQNAVSEISHYTEFDYLVVNDAFDTALYELQAIVTSRRLRREVQGARLKALINNLLAQPT
jgi:guanylate kinase